MIVTGPSSHRRAISPPSSPLSQPLNLLRFSVPLALGFLDLSRLFALLLSFSALFCPPLFRLGFASLLLAVSDDGLDRSVEFRAGHAEPLRSVVGVKQPLAWRQGGQALNLGHLAPDAFRIVGMQLDY
jgi:hypothetical protein